MKAVVPLRQGVNECCTLNQASWMIYIICPQIYIPYTDFVILYYAFNFSNYKNEVQRHELFALGHRHNPFVRALMTTRYLG